MKRVGLFIRLGLGVLFVAASADKLLHPGDFVQVILNYHLTGPAVAVWTAALLPWLELLCGLALILNRAASGAALLVALMLAGFLAAEGSALARGLDISCGCFHSDPMAKGGLAWSMARDTGLFVLALLTLLRWDVSNKRQDSQPGQ
jgi:uncharacterized membrane protein YphA (DoxX/SURF4 family)